MPQQMQQSFKIYRMSLSWFDVGQCYEQFSLDAGFPVFFWQLPGFDKWIYGFPAIDGPTGGLKVAATDDFSPISVDKVCRQVSEEEVERAYRTYISPCLPALGGPLRSSTCLITATPDSEFVIDYVPGSSRVLLVSACSGHGFKHSAAVGECIGSLIKDGRSAIDISHFSLQRLFSEDRDPSA